jgi:hypothetical protein
MSHDHIGVMLDALMAVPLPEGYIHARRDRYDPVTEHTARDVTISPAGVDPSTFAFGTTGAYAHISVDDGGDTYTVGVFATGVGYEMQSAGHVVHFTTAPDAVCCAMGHLRGELQSQQHGW